ncbi:MAG: hypothetical protein V3T19_02880 [Acidiferrobacterales bacterium]|jgi:hypothetical protein
MGSKIKRKAYVTGAYLIHVISPIFRIRPLVLIIVFFVAGLVGLAMILIAGGMGWVPNLG